MLQARLFELGVVLLNVLALAAAVAVGLQISILAGVLVFVLLSAALIVLIYNFDYPLVRRMLAADDQVMLNLCRTGFVGRARRMLRPLPSNPRCRFCLVPFGGIGRFLRVKPSGKNPNYCRSCFEGLPTGTHEMELGVLFADIRGFTSWTESHPSDDAPALLTRFYEIANRELTADDAFVEFVGDEVMALYPVPMPSLGERTPEIMLAGARRLVHAIRNENDTLPVGVGLTLGVARVGMIAKGEVKDFTAVGDVVNTASRLQGQAGANEIVLSQEVYDGLAEQPEAEPVLLELKGKAESLRAFVFSEASPQPE